MKTDGKAESPIAEYTFTESNYSYLIKNNFFVGMEELRIDKSDTTIPLNHTETQILMTAFKMAHELNEKRIIFDANTVFKISLEKFYELWQIPLLDSARQSGLVYHNIVNSMSRLNNRKFRYKDDFGFKTVESGYFQFIRYNNNVLEFGFPLTFIPYLQQLNKFTWFYFENIIKLMDAGNATGMSSYSIALYEQLQKGKNKAFNPETQRHEFTFEANRLKKLLAIPKTYYAAAEFNRQVLTKVISYINLKIHLDLEVEYVKTGKSITHYKFTCVFPKIDLDFRAAIKKNGEDTLLTAAQRKRFAKKLLGNKFFYDLHCGLRETDDKFVERIENELLDSDKIEAYWSFLLEEGCKSKKIEKFIAQRQAEKLAAEQQGEGEGESDSGQEVIQGDPAEQSETVIELEADGTVVKSQQKVGSKEMKTVSPEPNPDDDPNNLELPF